MFAVIMAGGSGTRFWPASRDYLPKQFLKITSERTMWEETQARAAHFAAPDRTYTVVGKEHAELVAGLIGDTPVRVITEPRGRNTAACIGLAAIHIKQEGSEAIDEPIVILPADHFVADAERFAAVINAAAEIARTGAIVTLGIAPTRPETGYGYIELDAEAGTAQGQSYYLMRRFVEKPNHETALQYLAGGRHLWNSGIFIFTARTILREIEACMPELSAGLREIEGAIGDADYGEAVARVYDRIEGISIDYGVMEKTAAPVYVLRADFGWSDVGSWQALYELRASEYDEARNLALGEVMAIDAGNNLVYGAGGRVVALLGVEDLMIVDTPDALLVARLDRSQEVKLFAERLKKS
jgi:mannose-1-phosphate guanylyltransferase